MTNAVYTISFWDGDNDPIRTDNASDCAEYLADILDCDEGSPFFIVKSTCEDRKAAHEDVTSEIYERAAHEAVWASLKQDDVPGWAIDSDAFHQRFSGYAPAGADREAA